MFQRYKYIIYASKVELKLQNGVRDDFKKFVNDKFPDFISSIGEFNDNGN